MVPLVSLLVVLSLSLLIVRIATTALTMTGVSKELARFQARSAFTGVGYTTGEAERMMDHPARRRILMILMLVGNAGVITAVSSLVLSFVDVQGLEALERLLWVLGGVTALWLVALSGWVEKQMHRVVQWLLRRGANLEVVDYTSLLRVSSDYSVRELKVEEGDWLAERTLGDLSLADEGVLVLGIVRRDSGDYVGAPQPGTKLRAGDVAILYGWDESLEELDDRDSGASGEGKHQRGVERQDQKVAEQERREKQQKNNSKNRSKNSDSFRLGAEIREST